MQHMALVCATAWDTYGIPMCDILSQGASPTSMALKYGALLASICGQYIPCSRQPYYARQFGARAEALSATSILSQEASGRLPSSFLTTLAAALHVVRTRMLQRSWFASFHVGSATAFSVAVLSILKIHDGWASPSFNHAEDDFAVKRRRDVNLALVLGEAFLAPAGKEWTVLYHPSRCFLTRRFPS